METNVLNTDLTGKVAVVTGAGGVLCGMFGMGALLAAYFARVTTDDPTYKGTMSAVFCMVRGSIPRGVFRAS